MSDLIRIGDKVEIVSESWLSFHAYPLMNGDFIIDGAPFRFEMREYCGSTVTISKIVTELDGLTTYYRIKEDSEIFKWTKKMFYKYYSDKSKSLEVLDINSFCKNTCIMICSKECPLFKYKD